MVRVLRPPTQHNKLSLPSYTFADNLLRFSCVPQLRVVDSLPSVTGLNIKVTRSSGRFPLLGACSPVCSAQGYPQEELEKGWALAPVLTLLDCLPLAGLMQDLRWLSILWNSPLVHLLMIMKLVTVCLKCEQFRLVFPATCFSHLLIFHLSSQRLQTWQSQCTP